MAKWGPLHKPVDFRSGLETAGQAYNPPLLPYEVALIEALGCTEQEYREFVRYAELRSRVRPAAYAHIPNIQNDPVTLFVINLVVGLALTAASVLLAPKAPALESQEKIKGKKLADQIGPARFNQTSSFDNVASLAEYGQAIPVPFGRRGTGADGELTGGLVIAPSLVWSRCYSYGTYQAFEGIYVVGQAGMDPPEIGGVRIGTVALDNLDQKDYALYWSSVTGDNFPKTKIAGTDGPSPSGTQGRTPFVAPSSSGEDRYGFSMSYNPTSKTVFGTATPIHNGTGYRFNWEIVSAPRGPDNANWDDNDFVVDSKARRRKIAGKFADVIENPAEPERRGQPGLGREYSRQMGIIAYNGTQETNRKVVTSVAVGDTCKFLIHGGDWRDFAKKDFEISGKQTGVTLSDLESSADAWRTRASDLMAEGSKWIIGNCVWMVETREPEFWKRKSQVEIKLRCVEVLGVASLGIAGKKTVTSDLAGYDGEFFDPEIRIGTGWWNICAFNDALVRPVRRDSRAIEIGIRSQVWNKANGLCNFNAIPTPFRLLTLDRKNVQLNTPRMDKYFARTSCFSILVRPVAKYGESPKQWRRIPEVFCVTGQSPIDQYNYIRIEPKSTDYFEYRIVPRTGTDIWINSSSTEEFIRLKAQYGREIKETYTNTYGTFVISTTGEKITRSQVEQCREMYSQPGQRDTIEDPTNRPTIITFERSWGNGGTSAQANSLQAWLTEILGYAPSQENKTVTGSRTVSVGARSVTVRVTATSRPSATNPYYWQNITGGSKYNWDNVVYEVTNATGNWSVGEKFTSTLSTTGGNIIGNHWKYKSLSVEFRVARIGVSYTIDDTKVSTEAREFEDNTQLVDVSHYQELTKSNENGPEHEIVYINEFIDNNEIPQYDNMSVMGLSINSSSKVSTVGQLRAWMPDGIKVFKALTLDEGFTNRFAEIVYYLLTDVTQGIGNTLPEELVDLASLQVAAQFQKENKIFFDGVLEDIQNIRSFIYDNAPLHLCNFTIKNGRFGLMPAVPYEKSGKISSRPIQAEQIFTAGNIIADSLQVSYIDAAQRTNFRAVVLWRVTTENDLPTQASAFLNWADLPIGERATTQQTFDLTDFCTNREQALLTARFLMSIRRRVTHTISFKTTPAGLGVEPGSYIRVITESTSYSANNNGIITDAGTLVSITEIENGTYKALVYFPQTSQVVERNITISGNEVTDSSLHGAIFTLLSTEVSKGVYQIEQITLDEDGLANIAAVHVPVDANGASIVVQDILTPARFTVAE
jgi:hypothetical protein